MLNGTLMFRMFEKYEVNMLNVFEMCAFNFSTWDKS